MGGCSMYGCTNRNSKGFRMFVFPRDPARRKKWEFNCKRLNFVATNSCQVCEVHFREDQFERGRQDGKVKLKWDAIPNKADDPVREPRSNVFERIKIDTRQPLQPLQLQVNTCVSPASMHSYASVSVEPELSVCGPECIHIAELKALQKQVAQLEKKIRDREAALRTFMNEDQILALEKKPYRWKDETIVLALKLRFALGVHGYMYLHDTGFPLPGYSTLTSRLREFKLEYGIFRDMLTPLQYKVSQLEELDRICVLSIDEMQIGEELALDKNNQHIRGQVTLTQTEKLVVGKKLLAVMVRGLRKPFKQIIGAHITPETSDVKDLHRFLMECLDFCIEGGLEVIGLGSDMGNENRKLWKELNIVIQKSGTRVNSFKYKDLVISWLPDVCHILKNLRSCLLNEKTPIILPEEYCRNEGLPNNTVSGKYIKELWNQEIRENQELRLLHHLNRSDLYPDNFKKMNVGSAVRMFSLKTAAAIESAVKLNLLEREALTTAHYIRLIDEWFVLTTSRTRKTSITERNQLLKYDVLERMISVTENTTFGKGWKPLNVGIIMASLSFLDIANRLLLRGYAFILGHRNTADAIENVFSQVRRKSGKMPNATQCLQALKCISISQYMSNISRSNYQSDSDLFLVDFFSKNKNAKAIAPPSSKDEILPMLPLDTLQTRTVEEICNGFSIKELNHLYYIAGSTTNSIVKKCCPDCSNFLSRGITDASFSIQSSMKIFKTDLTKGGLSDPCPETFSLILNCEFIHNEFRCIILRNSYRDVTEKIIRDIEVDFCPCEKGCEVKRKIVTHFFMIRGYTICNLSINNKRKSKVFGSASAKKQKT